LFNLDSTMWLQVTGFVLLTSVILVWAVQFTAFSGLDLARTPLVNTGGFSSALSTIIFNYGFVVTLPSWLAEKKPTVRVASAVWSAIGVSTAQFFVLGLLGAWALDFAEGDDVLAVLTDPTTPRVTTVAKIGAFILPMAALLSGIPVFSIIIRYNLLQVGIPLLLANVLGVAAPWALALVFFAGNQLRDLVTWSSALLFVVLNFCLPVALYLVVLRADAAHDAALRGERGAAQPESTWLARSPRAVDRRLEALAAARAGAGDLLRAAPRGRRASIGLSTVLAPVVAAITADAEAAAAAAYAAGEAPPAHPHIYVDDDKPRLAPAPDGGRDEVEDAELVPGLARCFSPSSLAVAVIAVCSAIALVTFTLQVYQTAVGKGAANDGPAGANATNATNVMGWR
jgi:hypothetical protein